MSSVLYAAMLTVTLIATVTDFRSGLIPNWLTFPALLFGPFLGAAFDGWHGAATSLLGIAIAGGIPLLFHHLGGMGAGDVKLFAALGGLGGVRLGLEIELYAASCACCWGIVMLTYRGRLLASLHTSARLFANVLLPAEQQRTIAAAELTQQRIGSAIFAGTLLAVMTRVL